HDPSTGKTVLLSTLNIGRFLFEMAKFFASRIATLLVDLLIMFLLVDLPGLHGGLYEFSAKIFSNIIVLILNFILSKIFVFRKKKPKKNKE
ncbi:MAG: GtrA family protein, partial [Oscillospiraceae bacterium]|nr:GtrA family protein [Oscillospiraceae bacterium]